MRNDIIFNVAKWFIQKDESITQKKMQKLCYYAYAWYIAFNNDKNDSSLTVKNIKRLGIFRFKAWIHGPTCEELYCWFTKFEKIHRVNFKIDLPEEVLILAEQVWKIYGRYTGDELEMMIHTELPWIKTRVGLNQYENSDRYIDEIDMLQFYSTKTA